MEMEEASDSAQIDIGNSDLELGVEMNAEEASEAQIDIGNSDLELGVEMNAEVMLVVLFGEADDMRFIDSLKNSTKLEALTLYNCNLMGVLPISIGLIPDSLGNLSLLTELHLDSNNLEGHIPSCLGKCKELTVLSLRDNRLSGKIPKQILQLPSLTIGLDLSQNSLSSSIPLDIKDLKMMNILDLSYNNLSGTITNSLGECVSLTTLNLQGNQFQGIIPSSIHSLRGLEGEVPVVGVFANASAFSVLGNNRLCGGLVKLELPKCKEKGSKKKRREIATSQPSQSSGNERSVYKGILDSHDAKFVAVKVLHLHNRGARKSFLAECEAWRNIRHRNLLKIITSCSSTDFQGNDFKALVYEFMSNGSVHDWLHSKYGIGSEMTSSGDVYSFGIVLLEVMTGKKPTDDMFNNGLSLHKFAYMALPDHVVDVIDNDAIIGVSCSVDSPPQRMKIEIVVNELHRILDVSSSMYGEVESNCNKE
ncbi:kinase-like domain-containing protein [Tanacetum coccineum]|uniref:Kinase-like domain-containing protein n=1 Tax=Tanacetum coccineum TaxID=301880 RepID=A0ABQ5G141_9ASTR